MKERRFFGGDPVISSKGGRMAEFYPQMIVGRFRAVRQSAGGHCDR
jgi:hypothetical protein